MSLVFSLVNVLFAIYPKRINSVYIAHHLSTILTKKFKIFFIYYFPKSKHILYINEVIPTSYTQKAAIWKRTTQKQIVTESIYIYIYRGTHLCERRERVYKDEDAQLLRIPLGNRSHSSLTGVTHRKVRTTPFHVQHQRTPAAASHTNTHRHSARTYPRIHHQGGERWAINYASFFSFFFCTLCCAHRLSLSPPIISHRALSFSPPPTMCLRGLFRERHSKEISK